MVTGAYRAIIAEPSDPDLPGVVLRNWLKAACSAAGPQSYNLFELVPSGYCGISEGDTGLLTDLLTKIEGCNVQFQWIGLGVSQAQLPRSQYDAAYVDGNGSLFETPANLQIANDIAEFYIWDTMAVMCICRDQAFLDKVISALPSALQALVRDDYLRAREVMREFESRARDEGK